VTEASDLAARVDRATASNDPRRSLDRGSLRFPRTIALSVGIQGPTAGVIVGPAIIASIVGGPGALAQVVALGAMAFVAYAFVRFTRAFNTAGSVYAFNASAVGPRFGFLSAWLLLLVYVSFASGVFAASADIAQTFFASLGLHGSWVWYALAGAGLAIVLAYLSIGLSSLLILVFEGTSILLITVVGVAVVIKGGYHHHPLNLAPFELHGLGLSVVALGVVAAFGQFSGFEGAATLGEEARQSTRTIPAAIAWSLVVSAAVYIGFTWIVYNAYPTPAAVAADPAPLVHVASGYVGPWVGTMVNFAGMISAFGAQLALLNAASRLAYGLAREADTGTPVTSFLARTSPRHRSPSGALVAVGVLSVAGLLTFSTEALATRAAALTIQFGAYLLLVAYLFTVIGALAWTWRTDRRPLPITLLGAGIAVLGYILYRTFVPFPAAPFDWVVLAAAAASLLGVAILFVPGLLDQMRSSELLRVTAADLISTRPTEAAFSRAGRAAARPGTPATQPAGRRRSGSGTRESSARADRQSSAS
jgi:amino acid transporter